MDSKALLAIVFSVLLFFLWQHYLAPPPIPIQQKKSTTTASAPQAPPPPPASLGLPTVPKVNLAAQKTWSIGDKLYNMKIISQGARQSSFELLKFRQNLKPDSPPIQLVRNTSYLPLDVQLVYHKELDLSGLDYSSSAPSDEEVQQGQASKSISFKAEIPGKLSLTKTFIVKPDSYAMNMEIRIRNLSKKDFSDRLGISFYFKPYTTGERFNPSRLTYSIHGSNHDVEPKSFDTPGVIPFPINWLAYQDNYFIQAILPPEHSGYQLIPSEINTGTPNGQITRVVYLTNNFDLAPNDSKTFTIGLYNGPKEISALKLAGHDLAASVDYGWFSFLAKPLLVVLRWLYSFTGNYGVAIILLTVMIKIVFWPLTHKSYTSMQKMKKIQPKIQQIREKYKDDREKLNQELMQIYKTYKVNPMGGCLPMLLQIPVFFALYRMLEETVELRHKPFLLWINDLTAPDRLHAGFSVNLPFIGVLNGIPVLTIFMGVTMFIQQKMTPTGGDPTQEKIMLIMPIMFTLFFINFPSGLVLYWFVNNVISIAQQYWINRHAAA
ncbi:MAG: membrane protein insertase YidC [Deltaproteobacteria bacterium]|jgi:YidC/Oxa1 family membrane protein insertase|nr:membrane protein insertase YidC [Deltaproteobacteria bacterium]